MDFILLFGFVTSVGGLWMPSMPATVVQIDTTAAIVISVGVALHYPSLATVDLRFICSQAGIFPCAFHVNAGDLVFFNSNSAFTTCFAYLNDAINPAG